MTTTHEEYHDAQQRIARERQGLALLDQLVDLQRQNDGPTVDDDGNEIPRAEHSTITDVRKRIYGRIRNIRHQVCDPGRPNPVTFLQRYTDDVRGTTWERRSIKVGPMSVEISSEFAQEREPPKFRDPVSYTTRQIPCSYDATPPLKVRISVEGRNRHIQIRWPRAWVPVSWLVHLKHGRVGFTDDKGWGLALTHKRYPTNRVSWPCWIISGRGGNNRLFTRRFMAQLPDGSVLVRKTFKALEEACAEQVLHSLGTEFGVGELNEIGDQHFDGEVSNRSEERDDTGAWV